MSKQHGRVIDVKQEEVKAVKVEPQIQQVEKLAEPTVSLTPAQIDALVEKRMREMAEIEASEKTRLATERNLNRQGRIDKVKTLCKQRKNLGYAKDECHAKYLASCLLEDFSFNPTLEDVKQFLDPGFLRVGEIYLPQSYDAAWNCLSKFLQIIQPALHNVAKQVPELKALLKAESVFTPKS